MSKIQPLGNNVVVEAIKEEVSSSGIIIPDTASKEKPMKGKVLAVGSGKMANDGKTLIVPDIEVGDTVLFSKYGPTEVKLDGKTVLILSVDDIFAKIK
ncbi:co-chaperone GroES [Candidatus Gracilibacteria bacterium]|nr:co-chaperone GroES [Candidatus Gracilibacteria bacterium]